MSDTTNNADSSSANNTAAKPLRLPLFVRLMRLALGATSRVSADLAARWAYRLWFRPLRFPEPRAEQEWRANATPLDVKHRGQPLAVDVWGRGPTVLLVHGWHGRGAQLGAFVAPLQQAGFRIVSFDAPAHGRSPGAATNLPEITESLLEVARAAGPLHAIISHSFGVPCTFNAIKLGLTANRVVAVSPPSTVRGMTDKFFATFGLSPAVRARFNRLFERDFGDDVWDRFAPELLARQLSLPGLVLHDQDDHDVPIAEGEAVAEAWPGAQFVRTQGLGHRRILKDPEVLARVVAFVAV